VLVVLALVAVVAVLAAGVGPRLPSPGRPSHGAAVTPDEPTVEAAAVLRGWDAARAEAWAAGSVRSLRRLYADGAGERDVGLLRDYLRRGLTLDELRVQVLALDVLRHGPGEWRLRVTDRVVAGVVTGRDGARRPLPRDQATTRDVVLVRHGAGWRVAEVVPLES
jgi:hypothetical protein